MKTNSFLTVEELGKWLAVNGITRAELAEAIGLSRSTIDNYFSQGKFSQHAQILISRYIRKQLMPSEHATPSVISVRIANELLNLAIPFAVKRNMTLENLMAIALEEKIERDGV